MESLKDGMHDIALKPKLIRSLLRDYVPDDKHPFNNPSELSYVVSTVKTHKLLSEWTPEPTDKNLVELWKVAVDSWIRRLLSLASSSSPDKCWAGICLLGVTCQDCSLERFLASYIEWINKILPHIQAPEVSHLVKAAGCASLSDMFIRLSGLSNAKRDATSQAAKIISAVLNLLNEDVSPVVVEEAVCLLCTMIQSFPQSAHRHYDSIEVAVVSKLMSGNCSASIMKKLGYGLSLLPKSRGDGDTWSLMMMKILLSTNRKLNDALLGLEEEYRATETMKVLLPPGKEIPPPLGGVALSEKSSDISMRRPERLLGTRISALMNCCCNMLTSSYPVMVTVPIPGLVALVRRVLMVDGSFSQSSQSLMTVLKQEFMCSELPLLQFHTLEILMAVVKGLNNQLLPHAADIVQLLTRYLRICTFPDLRIKAYSIMKVLTTSMGVGFAVHLGQDIVNNVFVDLDFPSSEKNEKALGLTSEPRQRKRKHQSVTGFVQEQSAHDGIIEEMQHKSTPVSVKKAALEILESLLTVGGSMKSKSWRANVDHLVITVAMDACKGGFSDVERKVYLSGEHKSIWLDFQLAALRALLASLLSPGRVRPPHLALGLELFRKGTHETGTKLAEFCGHALLSLEVLIHPRALPLLEDFPTFVNNKFPNTVNANGKRQVYSFQAGNSSKDLDEQESDNDELYENWVRNDGEPDLQITQELENSNTEKPHVEFTSVANATEAIDIRVSENQVSNKSIDGEDDVMVESPHLTSENDQITCEPSPLGFCPDSDLDLEPLTKKIALTKEVVEVRTTVVGLKPNESNPESFESEGDGYSAIIERMSVTLSNMEKSEKSMFGFDHDSSMEGIPDIVDVDPDSD